MYEEHFSRDASNRLTFGIVSLPACEYRSTCRKVASKFGLAPRTKLVSDEIEVAFQDYGRGNETVGLEWDDWSGFIVVAQSPESEPLVREIGTWLQEGSSHQEPSSDHGWSLGIVATVAAIVLFLVAMFVASSTGSAR